MQTKIPEPFFFEGDERAVILFHAYTGSANDVRMLGRRLNREGYTVYAPHLTGHATMDVFDLVKEGNPDAWLQDGQNAYNFMIEKGYKNIAVFGLSLGGSVATSVILNNPAIGGGVFNSPIVTDQSIIESNVPTSFMTYAKQVLKYAGKTQEEINQRENQLSKQLHATLTGIQAMNQKIRERLVELKVPFYIAASGKDELVDPTAGGQLADTITTAPVHLSTFNSATHVITVGKYHHEFEDTVIEFLTNLNWE
ncbi:esterase [Aerococcus viridans]|uniref:Esterase n=1 Tax=Aerococcus viridans TaxID=1377 RepID=A0A2N6UBJ9_9LACT|nr:alpha/beta hydrolase [Aerococcus viridans]PMC78930.1 esterase [Aerococcus viridans]